MVKKLLFTGSLLALTPAFTQTSIFFEDFEGGAGAFTLNTATQGGAGLGGINTFVVNNVYTGGSGTTMICSPGFAFTNGNTPPQPIGVSNQNGNYLHLLSDEGSANGILNASYRPVDGFVCEFVAQSNFSEMTNDISTTGYTNVTLEFWWLHNGSTTHVGELWYSTNGGATWVQKTGTNYHTQSNWIQQSVSDPAWDNQANLKFGFRFNNGVLLGGADPALSIDDVEILGTSSSCTNTTSSFTETACFSYTVPSGDETYTTAGTSTVMDTISNAAGCDSIMTISLTINTLDNGIIDNGDGTASALSSTATYQWIGDCGSTDTLIAGETSQTIDVFNLYPEGSYGVIVSENGCVDTSNCVTITWFGISENETAFNIYPNPSNGIISIDLSNSIGKHLISVTDVKGSIVYSTTLTGGSIHQLNLNLEFGIYYLAIYNENKNKRIAKLIIEK